MKQGIKLYEVVGYTVSGETYCVDHEPDDASPIFMQEIDGSEVCEECGHTLECVFGSELYCSQCERLGYV